MRLSRSVLIACSLLLIGIACWTTAAASESGEPAQSTEVLLVANSRSDTVMLISAEDGSMINSTFISDTQRFQTVRQAVLHPDQQRILVIDQVADAIFAYDLQGNFIDVFAGQPLTSTLDNMRSMTWHPNGNLLVTLGSSSSPVSQTVQQIAPDGSIIGTLIKSGSGGLDSPFDVLIRQSDMLVSDSSADKVLRYDLNTGAFLGEFAASVDRFPQQLTTSMSNTVLVANFSGDDIGILEYTNTATGALVTIHDDLTQRLVSYRGVHELNNGNLLVSTGVGVYEMEYGGNVVATTVLSESSHYIERIPAITDLALTVDLTPTSGISQHSVVLQQPLTMTFHISNTQAMTATNVQLSFDLPEGLQHVADDQNCTVIVQADQSSSVVCELETLAPQAEAEVVFVIQPQMAGMYNLEAEVTLGELDAEPTNNSVAFTIDVLPDNIDLMLTVDLTPTLGLTTNVVALKQPFTMTFTISNTAAVTATNVQLSFDLPAGLQPISDTQDCTLIVQADQSFSVVCDLETLAPQSSTEVVFVIQPEMSGLFPIIAEVLSDETDTDPENNSVAFVIEIPTVYDVYLPLVLR